MAKTINNNMRQTCFFCSQLILDKKTEEHIIPDSLLGKLGLKEKTIEGKGKFLYSRLKVPAHFKCNSEFGSRYENEVLQILESPNKLFDEISLDEGSTSIQYQPSIDSISLISTWLSKIYYGLFYKDYLSLDNLDWAEVCKNVIDCENFRLIQKSYRDNHGFSLPSSLFAFITKDDNFDLRTFASPEAILLKVKNLVLILCIGDGYLTKSYLNKENLKLLRQHLTEHEKTNPDFPQYLLAFAEILAYRMSIPKTPKFVYSDKFMLNMSFSTGVKDPELFYKIDDEIFIENKKDVLAALNIIVE